MFPFNRKKESQAARVASSFTAGLMPIPPVPAEGNDLECITAEEASSLLRAGQPLVRKRIKGNVHLGSEEVSDPFEFELDGEKIHLAGLPFLRTERATFAAAIDVQQCWFEGKVNFAALHFKNTITVLGTRFCSEVDCQQDYFDKAVVIAGCRFEARLNCVDTIMKEGAHFDQTVFLGPADFYNATFADGCSCSGAEVRAASNFSGARFLSSELLQPCFQFDRVICDDVAFFRGSNFDGIADFSHTQFRRRVEFPGAQFRYVSFAKTEFGWLELQWEQIENGKLLFGPIVIPGFTAKEAITLEEFDQYFQNREEPPLAEKHRQYDILKGTFLRQGDFVSADACFYEWKQIERRQSPLGWNPENWIVKGFHHLNWATCGYGVKPIRTIFFASVVIILFAIAFSGFSLAGGFQWDNAALLAMVRHNLTLSFQAFMNFAPSGIEAGSWTYSLVLLERLFGWFTLLLFVTTYTKIMLR